jgi:hypothetical protein
VEVECLIEVGTMLICNCCLLAGSHKLSLGVLGKVANTVSHNNLVFVGPVFFLEGLAKNGSDLVHSTLLVISEDDLRFLQNELC